MFTWIINQSTNTKRNFFSVFLFVIAISTSAQTSLPKFSLSAELTEKYSQKIKIQPIL